MNTLTVYTVGDLRYGISEDREPSAIDIRDIHWLPPVSQHIAGITILDEHTVTLLDLRACLGLPAMPRNRKKYLLLRTGSNAKTPPAVFILPDTVGRLTITPDAINPLPEYLVSSVISKYTVCEQKPVLIIDTPELFRQAQEVDFTPPQSSFAVAATSVSNQEDACDYTLVDTADHCFAVPDTCIVASGACESVAYPIQPAPSFVAGIEMCEGKPVPLIDLAKRLNLETSRDSRLMLDVELDQQRFRFCIDALLPPISSKEVTCKQLPALLQNNWRQTALVNNGDILSILNVAGLMSGEPDSEAPASAYTAQSEFALSFGKEEVDIVEFEICGLRHALPKTEAEPAIGVLPVSGVSNAKPLVVGVSEYEGELLPVLDLSRCFGRNAAPAASWSMIPIGNGNFKALILTERSFAPRRLPVELHRDLPYENTENFVYGCFPDEAVVRLIFNVHALALHFDRARHQNFFQVLADVTQSGSELEDNPRLQQALFTDDADTFAPVEGIAPETTPVESSGLEAEDNPRVQTGEPQVSKSQTTESEASPQVLLARRLQKAVQFPAQNSTPDTDTKQIGSQEDPAEQLEEHKSSGTSGETATEGSKKTPPGRIGQTDIKQDEPDTESDFEADASMPPALSLTSGQAAESASDLSKRTPGSGPELAATATTTPDANDELETQPIIPSDNGTGSSSSKNEEPPADPDRFSGLPTEEGGLPAGKQTDPDAISEDHAADEAAHDPEEKHSAGRKQPVDSGLPATEPAVLADETPKPGEDLSEARERADSSAAMADDVAGGVERQEIGDRAESEPTDIGMDDPEIMESLPSADLQVLVDELLPEEEIFIEAEIDPETEETPTDDESVYEEIAADYGLVDWQDDEGDPAAGSIEEEIEPLPMHSAPESRHIRKKVIALCLAALLLIVALAAFTGWRPGWLGAADPVQAIHRPVSDTDAAKVPVKAIKPASKAGVSNPQPSPRPVAAAPAGDIQRDVPPAAADRAEESEPETRTIKIIDKDGRLVVYKVKKGDTLWGISEKYTGTGFNYPKLADDNRIKNPDLIFPRQRIKVK